MKLPWFSPSLIILIDAQLARVRQMLKVFPFKRQSFQLVRYYTTASLFAFVLAIVLLGNSYYRQALTDIIALGEQQNVALTQAFSNSLWVELAPFLKASEQLSIAKLPQHPSVEKLRKATEIQMEGLSVVKIKVFNRQGMTIFSSQADQIGQDKSGSEGFMAASSGKILTQLNHKDSFVGIKGKIYNRKLISSYIPIDRIPEEAGIEGVFELYSDVTPLTERLAQTHRNIVFTIILILGILYALLLWIVRRADRLIRQQNQALRASETSYRQQTQELEQTLKELHETQTQLIQQEKMSSLGQLVAGVAHEINNPVNFIYGNLTHVQVYAEDLMRLLRLYQQHFPNPGEKIEAEIDAADLRFLEIDLPKTLGSMKLGTERIREIVRSLRTFSHLDASALKPIDLHEGINSTLLILEHRLKSIKVIKNYGKLPLVECYAGQLNQVFMNLLANAIDELETCDLNRVVKEAQIQPGTITISTERVNLDRVRINISDNGSGMSETIKSRLFDPFFTTKPPGKGTGLGLSISYQIVTEKHHGTLCCFSNLGQGTCFQIELPVKQNLPNKAS
jgi:signal transduction histidine kinase